MIAKALIIGCFLVNFFLCLLLVFRNYQKTDIIPVFLLTFIIPLFSFTSLFLFSPSVPQNQIIWFVIYGMSSISISGLLGETVSGFLRHRTTTDYSFHWKTIVNPQNVFRLIVLVALLTAFFLPWAGFSRSAADTVIVLTPAGVFLLVLHFILQLFIVFTLETTYRYAADYQRKIARLCFIALFTILIFGLISLIRGLLYRTLISTYTDLHIIVLNVCFPFVLLGMVRYRLSTEKVSVPRETVYSSITLFLVGAFLLGLSATVYTIKRFGLNFNQFETFLGLFTLVFFVLLAFGSGTMRVRIVEFVNRQFYRFKYDYYEQFYRLHRSYLAGTDMDESVNQLIENIKYSVAAEDAYVFLLNPQDGNFHMHRNKEYATPAGLQIPGDNLIVATFRENPEHLDLISHTHRDRVKRILADIALPFSHLGITRVFPIFHNDSLVGILGIRGLRKKQYDQEDISLIEVFTLSIGDVYFKNKMLRERIQHKQFESFSRISSFIIHDIKNQAATLTLLSRNADKNITNPDFQKSLVRSIKSTAENLQELIDKLKAPPKEEHVALVNESVNPVISEVVENSAIHALPHLRLQLLLNSDSTVLVDRKSLFYVIKNLVTNALDAMNNRGTLKIESADIASLPSRFRTDYHIGDHLLKKKAVIISVEDSGVGMSRDFIENSLFHPFSSTKDKGVGIGLYQCKILIEKMGGKLLCHSVENVGSTFCILL